MTWALKYYLIFVHYVFRQSGRDSGAHFSIFRHNLGIRNEIQVLQDESVTRGIRLLWRYMFQEIILKRYKQHALSNLLWWKKVGSSKLLKVVGSENIISSCNYFLKRCGCQKWAQDCSNICLFLKGVGWGGDGNGFLLKAAPVGKCFFYRLCLVNHAFKWKHQKGNRIMDTEFCDSS